MQTLRQTLRPLLRPLCTTPYRTPGPSKTRPPPHQKPHCGPYELPDTPPPQYPKRRNPYKRTTALINALQEEEQLRMLSTGRAVFPAKIPQPRSGDIIRIGIKSGERTHFFTGICIAFRKRGVGSTVVLRNVVDGVAVERGVPFWSPNVVWAEVLGKRKVRRNKLYYLRDKALRESLVGVATARPEGM